MKEELPERYFYSKNKIVKIGQLLKESFPKRRFVDKDFQKVINLWGEVVRGDVYKSTKIMGIKNGIMQVHVESSAMIHYLTNFEKFAIIQKINNLLGMRYIEDIRFKVGMKE